MNTRTKAGIGIAAAVVAVVAIGLGTYAAFTDSAGGPSGTAAAGTLDLTLDNNASKVLFNQNNLAPGFSTEVDVSVRNVGSIDGTLSSAFTVSGADGQCTDPERALEALTGGGCAPGGNLQDQMTVQVLDGPGVTAGNAVPLKTFVATGLPTTTLAAGASGTYKLLVALPAAADNRVQGDAITLGSTFTLNQKT
ncbi:TasA family protein [Pseudonocardia spirodelae]|uniref:TasA family protein n=1 Tax=Pseudonocardia spirodelae TaxID=3133431 RepID=A0ABU8T9T7_9PSEU